MANPAEPGVDYLTLKTLHQTAVLLSFAGFFVRGGAALAGAAWVRGRMARTLPHVVDTVLLASAIAMAWMLRLNPVHTPWLAAKIVALVVYIVLGAVALRPGRSREARGVAWVGALLCFGYIVSVAVTKAPLGFIAWLS
jgi:uncharacterized membrane protein SirB2